MIGKNNGGPAFPVPGLQNDENFNGMSLRDWFAGQTLIGCVTNPVSAEGFTFAERAAWCYEQADAMLAERAKP